MRIGGSEVTSLSGIWGGIDSDSYSSVPNTLDGDATKRFHEGKGVNVAVTGIMENVPDNRSYNG